MAYKEDLGKIKDQGKAGYVMVGYDDIYAVEYFTNHAWHTGSTTAK